MCLKRLDTKRLVIKFGQKTHTMPFPWTCPYCQRNATIESHGTSSREHIFNNGNILGLLGIITEVIVCPNPVCREYAIFAALFPATEGSHRDYISAEDRKNPILTWDLKPQSSAQTMPEFVPEPIKKDYEEACLIRSLSPKASATLSRRCLQGIIRDFWGISKRRLIDEVEAIKDKTDPLTWKAIDSVRKIGNIGAHMEKDINLIIEVDDSEAGLLINLLEVLIKDWYIARHERELRLSEIISIADAKDEARKLPKQENGH
jgi:hypothetical protein